MNSEVLKSKYTLKLNLFEKSKETKLIADNEKWIIFFNISSYFYLLLNL